MSSGRGRGGRGALLLKALETQTKMPGQAVLNGRNGVQSEEKPVTAAVPTSSKKPLAFGRGMLAQQLALQMQKEEKSPPGVDVNSSARLSPPTISPGLPSGASESTSPTSEMKKMTITPKKSGERGTHGAVNPMQVNYIGFKCREESAFQYDVSFEPPVESKNMRFGMVKEHNNILGKTKAFDGSTLYLAHCLPEPQMRLSSKRLTDGTTVEITFTLVKVLSPSQCLQLYNIILRRIMKILDLHQVGRYFYDPKRPDPIPQHKLEIWPGYITAIQEYEGGVMLLADVSHRLLRTDTCLNYMYDIVHKNPNNYQNEVTKQLVGCIVLTRYNNRTYRIDDIAWDKSPESKFTYYNGEEMSYVEYYRKFYNKELSDNGQPLLIHHPKEGKGVKSQRKQLELICLMPELCSMTGLTDTMRSDFRVMKDIAMHTRITPNQRQLAMKKFVQNIYATPAALAELDAWGLELDKDLLKTDGRLLPPEKIVLGSKTIMCNAQADWGREVTRESVISAVAIKRWMLVTTKRDHGKASEFVQTMKQCCGQMGIQCAEPTVLTLNDDRTESYLRTIRDNLEPSVQCVVCIFPTARDDRYAAVKKLCCVESPVPSQMINARTISQANKLRSVTQKIILQINCKLGGELWALQIPMKNVMICGIDVHHDTLKGNRSIAGFVASSNSTFTRWYSRCAFQQTGQEVVDGLKVCLVGALKHYHNENHCLPERIILFRDGVGDGQLTTVSNYEVKQIRECFPLLGETYKPKLCVIVVQKRISQRLFAVQGNTLENPAPGSILDHTVTRTDWSDFFLVSQHVRQGTVTPTHYVVVYNDTGMKPDHVQRLSYKLTHLYYNWPGTIRVPAPCQYAHKLAFLVGTSLHKDPAIELSDRLFFL